MVTMAPQAQLLLPSSVLAGRYMQAGAARRPRRSAVFVRAEATRVLDLIQRDKRQTDVVEPSAFDEPSEALSQAGAKPAGQKIINAKAATGPQRCREAINLGLDKFKAGDYQAAIELFETALELPGSGVMRVSGTVREYSCPSEGEEHAALYNMACAYARLGQRGPTLTCLEGLLEAGFDDIKSIRSDADLALVRGEELDRLLSKHDNPLNKLLGRKKKGQEAVGQKNRWIQW